MLYEREFELGCKLSPYDMRDHKVAAVGVLPDSFELDFSNIKIKNQGQVGSCVAHAMSTILEYHNKGYNTLSTNFFYGLQNEYCGHDGKGMYLRDACKMATNLGDALEEDCPGNTEVPKCRDVALKAYDNEEAMEKALHFRTKSYYSCSNNNDIKYALINYGPILASVKWYRDFKVNSKGVLIGGQGQEDGNHCIVIYGYNETGFLCQNSWGKNWGNKGRFVLPYSIKVREARGLIDLENDDYIAPPKPNKFLNQLFKILNYIINLLRNKS